MMNPSRIFIERPVATSLLMIAIFLTGLLSYRFLPVAALPDVEYPTLTVTTIYPGANPDVVESTISEPLETQLGEMPGLDQMISQSSGGASLITMRFGLNMSMDVAEQQVQAAINQAGSLLPSDLPAPPIYAKVNPADTPILTLAVTSNSLKLTSVQDYVTTRLLQHISQVPGVGLVTLAGGQRKAYRIQINIPKLTSYGIALDTVRTILGTVNVNAPSGAFEGPLRATTLHIDGQIKSPEELMNQIIGYQNNGAIRLRDVGQVVEGPENAQLAAWSGKAPALILSVQRQPGANVVAVVDKIKSFLPRLQSTMPPGITITELTDRTSTIRASVADVEFELALAILLVVGVIFVFLSNVPATLIPSLSVPISIVGSLGVVYLLGYSLDNLSLMAMTIATGFVVDDAIVVIENISRYIEKGEDRYTAAIIGSREIGFTIISLTVSLIAVLIPLLFMGDVVGRLFHEFAVTLAVTIALSAVVAVTLIPSMCARLLTERPHSSRNPGRWGQFARGIESGINRLIAYYARLLDIVLAHRRLTALTALLTLVLTLWLAVIIPKGFFPTQDTGLIQGITQMPETISFEGMKDRQSHVIAALLKVPDVENISGFIGVDGENMTLNTGRLMISLKPRKARTASLETTLARLSQAGNHVVGARLYLQPVQDLSLDSALSATQYKFVLENADYDAFKLWVPRLIEALQQQPALKGVTSDLQSNGLMAYLTLDRATAARYAITPQTVDNLLYDSFGQRQVSTVYTQSNQYRLILEAEPRFQGSLEQLKQLYLPGAADKMGESASGPQRRPSSGLVPLSQVTTQDIRRAPLLITHYGHFPATTISFNIADGYSLSDATSTISRAQAEIHLPPAFETRFQGTAAAFQAALSHELFLIIAALAAVHIVLGILYESFIHPLTILSTLPSAGVGALIALIICGKDLDVMGIIGIVLLIGIVKKNAIMMIDFALEAERRGGQKPLEAIKTAAIMRFRPILMTTLAAFFGALPLAIDTGVGAELRRPLGIAIIGGLVFSQLLTLFTTPVIYLYLDHVAAAIRRRFGLKTYAERIAEHGDA